MGNIWFAPIVSVDEKNPRSRTDYNELSSFSSHLGRWALPADSWGGNDAIVELRFATPVRANWVRSILDAEIGPATQSAHEDKVENELRKGFVVAHLPPELCDELAARWTAFSARRGPFAAKADADKFADLMANAELEQQGVGVAHAVVQTILASWNLEGRALANAGDAFDVDSHENPEPHLEALRAHLNLVREAAQSALDAIDS